MVVATVLLCRNRRPIPSVSSTGGPPAHLVAQLVRRELLLRARGQLVPRHEQLDHGLGLERANSSERALDTIYREYTYVGA